MHKNKKAFTLIELLVVVLIIGILSAIALPQYNKAVEKARFAEAIMAVEAIARAQDLYKLANGNYTRDINDLDITFGTEDAEYNGYPARQGKYFKFVATNAAAVQSDKAIVTRQTVKNNSTGTYSVVITINNVKQCILYSGVTASQAALCKEWGDTYSDYSS